MRSQHLICQLLTAERDCRLHTTHTPVPATSALRANIDDKLNDQTVTAKGITTN